MGKTCFFIGHGDAPSHIQGALSKEIEHHITECDVTDFLVGNHGGFDRMATQAVVLAKKQHPSISLYLMLAYLPAQGQDFDHSNYNGAIYPSGMELVPHKVAIPNLNRLVICEADYLLAYVEHSWGGAAKALEYARSRERKGQIIITNLGEEL